jgi:hypothetical protein
MRYRENGTIPKLWWLFLPPLKAAGVATESVFREPWVFPYNHMPTHPGKSGRRGYQNSRYHTICSCASLVRHSGIEGYEDVVLILWMRSKRAEAGSSLGSWGTSSPRKALAKMDWVSLSIWALALV